jgi:hypothetical protein
LIASSGEYGAASSRDRDGEASYRARDAAEILSPLAEGAPGGSAAQTKLPTAQRPAWR